MPNDYGIEVLSDRWEDTVVKKSYDTGEYAVDIQRRIRFVANQLFMKKQMLDVLKENGAGLSPEAEYLRSVMEQSIENIENKYGDVFKNIT